MPLMLLGEFCRKRRGGERLCPQQPAHTDGAPPGRPSAHSLLEVRLCRLTLERKNNPIQFLACSSTEGSPLIPGLLGPLSPSIPVPHCAEDFLCGIPLRIFLCAQPRQARDVYQAQLSQELRYTAGCLGRVGHGEGRGHSPNDPFMWCGSMPPMPPIGPSEPGPIGNWGRSTGHGSSAGPGPLHPSQASGYSRARVLALRNPCSSRFCSHSDMSCLAAGPGSSPQPSELQGRGAHSNDPSEGEGLARCHPAPRRGSFQSEPLRSHHRASSIPRVEGVVPQTETHVDSSLTMSGQGPKHQCFPSPLHG